MKDKNFSTFILHFSVFSGVNIFNEKEFKILEAEKPVVPNSCLHLWKEQHALEVFPM